MVEDLVGQGDEPVMDSSLKHTGELSWLARAKNAGLGRAPQDSAHEVGKETGLLFATVALITSFA
eukprot:2910467-Amphidinium_carterae.1